MNTVQRRHVFYLSGFDPRGASFYHRLFKEEAQKQTALNQIQLNIGARKKHSQFSQQWIVEAQDQGQQVTTHYEFLCWDDIIRQHWVKSFWCIFIDFITVSWVFITTGTLKRVANASRTPAITGLYPAIYITISGLIALSLGVICFLLFNAYHLVWLGGLMGLTLTAGLLYGAKIIGDRLNVFWLLRIYAFTARWAAGGIPSLDKRIDYFAKKIFKTLQHEQQDEVIIVSHSVGTMLAVAIAAQVAKKIDQQPSIKIQLHLITLGECIPLLSLLPNADAIRKNLAYLSATNSIYWVDYTSPVDGACFPLVNPVSVSLSPQQIKNSPLLLSTRFHTLYADVHYQKIRRNFYKMHFLYLMSHDIAGDYDFFALVTGKKSLKERLRK
jgi:hypothetical protein